MILKYHLIYILLAVGFFIFIIVNLNKKLLDIKYSLIWLLASVLIIIFSFFPLCALKLAALLGIETPVNALFLFAIFFLMIVSFMQSIILSKLSNRIKNLSQEFGITNYSSKVKEHDK